MPTVETLMVMVTATLNRAQNMFDALFTTVMGTNMVTKISAEATTVEATFDTVLTAVTQEDPHFMLKCVRIVLIMTTVLLMIALTVRMSVKSASRPTENLVIERNVKALISVMRTETAGTSAEWTLRRKMHIMRTMSRTVLTSAPTILPTEVQRKLPMSRRRVTVMFPGSLSLILPSSVPTLPMIRAVPELVARKITASMFGRLPAQFPQVQDLSFNLTLVMLPRRRTALLGRVRSMTLLNLLGATRCLWHPTAHRNAPREPLFSALAVDLTPRLVRVVAMLDGTSPHRVTMLGPS